MPIFFFKCSYEVLGLGDRLPETDELEFHFDKPRPIIVRLNKAYWDGQKPTEAGSAICTADTTEETVDEEMLSEINMSFSTCLNLSTSLVGKWANLKGRDPRSVGFLHGILDELYSSMIPTVTIFRWRCGLAEVPPDPIRNLRGYCSIDGQEWYEVSMARSAKIVFNMAFGPLPPSDEICRDVTEMVISGKQEPLGWQLFREAWTERMTRPASALVIGVAAAEVGFKKLVCSLAPQTQWLVEELQTPSLGKMLRKYLPTLPVKYRFKAKSVRPPASLLNRLDRAIECRNKLVHAGQPPPNLEELGEMLRAVSDFLWICDLYSGQQWAHKYISAEILTAWPDAPEPVNPAPVAD
jgi:hypothetical protein